MGREKKRNCISTKGAMTRVAEYIVDCESGEYDSYVSYCDENELDPKDIRGAGQSDHVYALALIGLGLEFPTDDACPQCHSENVANEGPEKQLTCHDCSNQWNERHYG